MIPAHLGLISRSIRSRAITSPPSHDAVQSLGRGLALLTALNDSGPLTLGGLCARLNLPRTTVRRLVQTLIIERCCLRVPGSALYTLAPGVVRLAIGYGLVERLTALAIDALPPLSRETGWPVALAAPEGLMMRVCVSTDYSSRFALARMRPGYTTLQVETTTGILHLASLDDTGLGRTLDETYRQTWPSPPRFSREEVQDLVTKARADDHLILERRFPEGSLGIPLRVGGLVRGGLVLRYVRSALKPADVRANLLPRLRDVAALIIAGLEAQPSGAVTGS